MFPSFGFGGNFARGLILPYEPPIFLFRGLGVFFAIPSRATREIAPFGVASGGNFARAGKAAERTRSVVHFVCPAVVRSWIEKEGRYRGLSGKIVLMSAGSVSIYRGSLSPVNARFVGFAPGDHLRPTFGGSHSSCIFGSVLVMFVKYGVLGGAGLEVCVGRR